MNGPLVGDQVVLWCDAPFCAQFLEEADRRLSLQKGHLQQYPGHQVEKVWRKTNRSLKMTIWSLWRCLCIMRKKYPPGDAIITLSASGAPF